MLSEKIAVLMDKHIKTLGDAAQTYLAAAVWSYGENLEGTSKYIYARALEKRAHMMKVITFVMDQDEDITITALEKPEKSFGTLSEMLQTLLDLEVFITAEVKEIMTVSAETHDFVTSAYMTKAVNNQFDDEVKLKKTLARLKLMGADANALYNIDEYIAGLD